MEGKNYYIKYTNEYYWDWWKNDAYAHYEWFATASEAHEWWHGYLKEHPRAYIHKQGYDELYTAMKAYCDAVPANHPYNPESSRSTDAQIVGARYEL